jgi:hypothetical protein
LGPLLFLLYVNDISSIVNNSKAILFADDTNLIFKDNSITSLVDKTNREIDRLYQWFNAKKLSLNTDKTKYIIFRPPHTPLPAIVKLTIDGNIIERVNSIKFLGVHIDEFLKWEIHINIKSNQIAKTLGIINRVKHDLHPKTIKTLYDSLIHPHFTYGVVAWGNTCNKALKRMNRLQKRAIRIITKAKYNAHTSPIFKSLNILTTQDIYSLNCCNMFWKRIHNKLPQTLHDLIPLNNETHSYATRQLHNVRPASSRNKIGDQQLSIKLASIFNSLPNSIKESIHLTTGSFSKKLKEYFVNKYPDSCHLDIC